MILYGIGVGPGDPGLLTLKAAEVLRLVHRVFYVRGPASRDSISQAVVGSLDENFGAKLQGLTFSMARDMDDRRESWRTNARIIADALEDGHDCAFATIGDPMIYSTFVNVLPLVKKLIPELRAEVVPGITSFQAAAARKILPLAMNDEVLTIVPSWRPQILRRAAVTDADTTVFLKTYKSRSEAADFARKNHAGESLYAERVGHPDEALYDKEAIPAEAADEYLSLLISRKRKHSDGLD